MFMNRPHASGRIAVALCALLLPMTGHAQTAAATLDTGDTAWMITSTVLVLFMTLPGLALFYGGLVRMQNFLSVLMHCFAIACLASVLWAAGLYSLAFSEGSGWIGDLKHLGLRGINAAELNGRTYPETVFVMFQMTFAIITPGLIVGAFVERMKFSAILLFSTLWLILIYTPVAHWVWGGGWMQKDGVLDLAGGIVVHTTAGVSALVLAMFIGPRADFPARVHPPHSPGMVMIGASMLWVGWFGFNAGSALAAGSLASSAFVATHFGAAAAALSWSAAEWFKNGRASALGAISGAVAGLVAITPAAGFVGPMPALIIGAVAGAACFAMVTKVKAAFGYDDALDAFGVHGAGGTIGALLTGVFAQQVINPIFGAGKAVGGLDGHWGQVGNQLVGVLVAWAFALVGTIVLLKIVDLLTGIRVTEDHELEGLDITQHGEEAYNLET